MNAAIAKIIAAVASDPENLKKILLLVGSIIIGALGVLLLPVYALTAGLSANNTTPADPSTKNNVDLAAWARYAYLDQWEYEMNAYGQVNPERSVPTTDTSGLVLGYRCYDAAADVFGEPEFLLTFPYAREIETMPDVEGIGVFDGEQFGIYIGNGDVIFASETLGSVVMEDISDREWVFWMLFDGIDYPETVTDMIGGGTG